VQKIVAIFKNQEQALQAGEHLAGNDLVDYRLLQLGIDYEQQLRQEIFFRHHEPRIIVLGAITGAIAGSLFFYFLNFSQFAVLLGRLNASGLAAVLFTGIGSGLALGALLAALYCLFKPLPGNYKDCWMLVLYCAGLGMGKRAGAIIKEHQGLMI